MINFRYHVVSLAAVFLALATGIVLGSTVIDQGFTKRLQDQANSLDNRLGALQKQNDTLTQQQSLWDSFAQTTLLPLMKDRLRGRSAVLLTEAGVDPKLPDSVSQVLTDAGATVAGRVALTTKWSLADDTARQQLALAVGVRDTTTNVVLQTSADRLASRLAEAADPTVAGDMLTGLASAGFLTVDAAGPGAFPPAGSIVVLIPTGTKDARPSQSQFFVPLVRNLALERSVVVAEPLASPDSLADRVRGDPSLRVEVSTVDDADLVLGRIALISAIRSLVTGNGAVHYGTRRSASSLVPATLS